MSTIEECIDAMLDEILRLKRRVKEQDALIEQLLRDNTDIKLALAIAEEFYNR